MSLEDVGEDLTTRTCAWCGNEYEPGPHPGQRYCGPGCRTKMSTSLRKAARPRPPRACAGCGGPLPTTNLSRRHCSLDCRRQAKRGRELDRYHRLSGKPDGHECSECGTMFRVKSNKATCSESCRLARKSRRVIALAIARAEGRRPQQTTRTCAQCGRFFRTRVTDRTTCRENCVTVDLDPDGVFCPICEAELGDGTALKSHLADAHGRRMVSL